MSINSFYNEDEKRWLFFNEKNICFLAVDVAKTGRQLSHHPDKTDGDKAKEELFKIITELLEHIKE